MTPPFELYRECDIADASGHICTAENPEIAKQILAALTALVEIRNSLEATDQTDTAAYRAAIRALKDEP